MSNVCTKTSNIGIVAANCDNETGDEIWLFPGCYTPFILRRGAEGYRLINFCYLHDFMDGDLSKGMKEIYRQLEKVIII
jgi:hypothetical protein